MSGQLSIGHGMSAAKEWPSKNNGTPVHQMMLLFSKVHVQIIVRLLQRSFMFRMQMTECRVLAVRISNSIVLDLICVCTAESTVLPCSI
jgi:hypothetical protein